MNTSKNVTDQVVSLVQRLPLLSQSVERLLDPSLEKHAMRDTVLEMAGKDSCLCAELLAMANSGCYSAPGARAVETVEEAWVRIDTESLRMLIASSTVSETIRERFMDDHLWSEYVAHTRAISRSCRILAGLKGMPPPEIRMYSVAGLTHDIGRVIIMIAADSRNASLMGTSPERMLQVVHDETEAYGLNHCEVGGLLYRRWRFSPIMQEGILRHHSPLVKNDYSHPGALIFVSHFVTMSDFTGEIIASMLGQRLLEHLNMSEAMLTEARRLYSAAT